MEVRAFFFSDIDPVKMLTAIATILVIVSFVNRFAGDDWDDSI
jgi:hypothetical protein